MGKTIVFINTYGRVASSSILFSVSKYNETYHFHNLSPFFQEHIKNDKFSNIDSYLRDHQIKIITGVRHPISRAISAFLTWCTKPGKKDKNHYSQYACHGKYFLDKDKKVLENIDINILVNFFLKTLETEEIFDLDSCWFQNNILYNYGIDVYNQKFNSNENYSIFQKNNIDLLLYRQENLIDYAHYLFCDFLKINDPEFKFVHHNKSSDRYFNIELFKNTLKSQIQQIHIDRILSNNKIMHFYTEKEIYNFLEIA
jgi:hypothetical protein